MSEAKIKIKIGSIEFYGEGDPDQSSATEGPAGRPPTSAAEVGMGTILFVETLVALGLFVWAVSGIKEPLWQETSIDYQLPAGARLAPGP